MKKIFLLQIFVSLFAITTWAWPPTYGAEFEITSEHIKPYDFKNNNPSLSTAKIEQMRFVELVRSRCFAAGCHVTETSGKFDTDYKVEFTDGWWFKISYDPGCVEITFKPSTLEVLKQKEKLINEHIFDTALKNEFYVRKNDTSHFNIGIRSAFNDSAIEFLKFYVDYANRPELALGVLGRDLNNAPPLSVLGQNQRQALQDIVQQANDGKIKTIAQAAKAIQDKVYTRSYQESWGGKEHYQAVGLKYVNKTDLTKKDAPMELRAIWIQESAEKFNLIAKLVEARIKYLKTIQTPVVYNESSRINFTTSEGKTRFAIYLEETGLNYEDYKDLIPEVVQKVKYSDFYLKDAPIEKRLLEVEAYWDLLNISHVVQKHTIKILSHPEVQEHYMTKRLMEKLRLSAATVVNQTSKRSMKEIFLDFFNMKPVKNKVNTNQVYKNILHAIDSKRNVIETPKAVEAKNKTELAKQHASSCRILFN